MVRDEPGAIDLEGLLVVRVEERLAQPQHHLPQDTGVSGEIGFQERERVRPYTLSITCFRRMVRETEGSGEMGLRGKESRRKGSTLYPAPQTQDPRSYSKFEGLLTVRVSEGFAGMRASEVVPQVGSR